MKKFILIVLALMATTSFASDHSRNIEILDSGIKKCDEVISDLGLYPRQGLRNECRYGVSLALAIPNSSLDEINEICSDTNSYIIKSGKLCIIGARIGKSLQSR